MCLSGALFSGLSAQAGFAAAVHKAPLKSDEVPDENSPVLVEKEAAESFAERTAEVFFLPLNLLDNIPHGPTHFLQPARNVTYSASDLSTIQQLLI